MQGVRISVSLVVYKHGPILTVLVIADHYDAIWRNTNNGLSLGRSFSLRVSDESLRTWRLPQVPWWTEPFTYYRWKVSQSKSNQIMVGGSTIRCIIIYTERKYIHDSLNTLLQYNLSRYWKCDFSLRTRIVTRVLVRDLIASRLP